MPRVLVADDNSNIQKMVRLALKDSGIDVVAVANGQAAVRQIPELMPDLILADIFMPVRSGYEVCEFVKQDRRCAHIPVVLLVGAFDPFDEREAQRVHADGVLKKPFVPPDPLINLVKTLLVNVPDEVPEPVTAGLIGQSSPQPDDHYSQRAMSPTSPLPSHPSPPPAFGVQSTSAEASPVHSQTPGSVVHSAKEVEDFPLLEFAPAVAAAHIGANNDRLEPTAAPELAAVDADADLVITPSRDPVLGEPVFGTQPAETSVAPLEMTQDHNWGHDEHFVAAELVSDPGEAPSLDSDEPTVKAEAGNAQTPIEELDKNSTPPTDPHIADYADPTNAEVTSDTAAIAEPLSAAPSGLQPEAISDVGAADDWAAIIAETHAGTDAETIAEPPATVEVTSVEAPPVEPPYSETSPFETSTFEIVPLENLPLQSAAPSDTALVPPALDNATPVESICAETTREKSDEQAAESGHVPEVCCEPLEQSLEQSYGLLSATVQDQQLEPQCLQGEFKRQAHLCGHYFPMPIPGSEPALEPKGEFGLEANAGNSPDESLQPFSDMLPGSHEPVGERTDFVPAQSELNPESQSRPGDSTALADTAVSEAMDSRAMISQGTTPELLVPDPMLPHALAPPSVVPQDLQESGLPMAADPSMLTSIHITASGSHVELSSSNGHCDHEIRQSGTTEPMTPEVLESVVNRIIDRMQPQVMEVLTREILRPVVEALVRRELDQR